MKLLGNLSRLITEIAALDDVQKSIKQKNVITINYDGDEYGKGYRDVEPVCLGVSKACNMVLRAWDRQGSSHSKSDNSGGNLLLPRGLVQYGPL